MDGNGMHAWGLQVAFPIDNSVLLASFAWPDSVCLSSVAARCECCRGHWGIASDSLNEPSKQIRSCHSYGRSVQLHPANWSEMAVEPFSFSFSRLSSWPSHCQIHTTTPKTLEPRQLNQAKWQQEANSDGDGVGQPSDLTTPRSACSCSACQWDAPLERRVAVERHAARGLSGVCASPRLPSNRAQMHLQWILIVERQTRSAITAKVQCT
ncbi:hypothetical protein B0T24DRAFT_370979 [Lasiosphaeria ovina]|uniref:Uncharacterized protein n=1 Tax=Lasiosphaeria ovina TaxID=92902 RepID=A0AAE0N1P6_9PEZI|nr:hypothetical protein B0T24DRAFT_370979 [Lasiosphaeria ovina]